MKLENTFVNTFEEGKNLLLEKIKEACSDISKSEYAFANCNIRLVALSDFPMSIICTANVCKKIDDYDCIDIYDIDASEMRAMDYHITINIGGDFIYSDNNVDALKFYNSEQDDICEYIDENCDWFTDNKTLFAVTLIEYFADDRDIDCGDDLGVFGKGGTMQYLVNPDTVADMYLYNTNSDSNSYYYNKYDFKKLQFMITAGGWYSFKTICSAGLLMVNPIAKIPGPILVSFNASERDCYIIDNIVVYRRNKGNIKTVTLIHRSSDNGICFKRNYAFIDSIDDTSVMDKFIHDYFSIIGNIIEKHEKIKYQYYEVDDNIYEYGVSEIAIFTNRQIADILYYTLNKNK